jgi:hypothetical protein
MFSDSMLSMPISSAEEPDGTSHWPAIVAVGCAWLIVLSRGIIGIWRHEGVNLDMTLTALMLGAIPMLVGLVWRAERRRSQMATRQPPRIGRPRLVLVSNH